MTGNLQVAESYLSGFTRIGSNQYSVKMYFEIRKQKFFEALEKYVHNIWKFETNFVLDS